MKIFTMYSDCIKIDYENETACICTGSKLPWLNTNHFSILRTLESPHNS